MSDAETNAADPYLVYFTSGTTSKPKLVAHTHQSYPVGHLCRRCTIGLQPGDVPLEHQFAGLGEAHAWSCFFAPWNAQACVFIYNFTRFDAARALDVLLVRYEVTTLCAPPPTVWRMLVQKPLKSYAVKLREIVGAGEPLNPEIIERVQHAWGLPIRDGYDQTETTAQIANTPGQALVVGSMGRPLPGCSTESGWRMCGRGRNSAGTEAAAAWPDDRLRRQSHRHRKRDARRLLSHTSDVASRSADGMFTYVCRADDVFNSSDYRLSPFELESVLIEHEAIAEAAVVPSPDPLRLSVTQRSSRCVTIITLGPKLTKSAFAISRERLAPAL